MHNTRIKFCGFTQPDDAVAAVNLGVDEIGLVFAGGPRKMSSAQASQVLTAVRALQQPVTITGLFMNHSAQQVKAVLQDIELDQLQFHGQENAEYCAQFGLPWTKAIAAGDSESISEQIIAWQSDTGLTPVALVLDAHRKGERGGQGKVFDWQRIPDQPALPIYLAGGLSVDNIADAVLTVKPYAVDVSSGIEDSPGIKNHATMQRFINEVKRADAEIDRQTG